MNQNSLLAPSFAYIMHYILSPLLARPIEFLKITLTPPWNLNS